MTPNNQQQKRFSDVISEIRKSLNTINTETVEGLSLRAHLFNLVEVAENAVKNICNAPITKGDGCLLDKCCFKQCSDCGYHVTDTQAAERFRILSKTGCRIPIPSEKEEKP